MKQPKLTIRDFTFVNDELIGPSYQNGPYAILVGRNSYAVIYRGQSVDYDFTDILSAVEACAKHEAAYKALEAK
jgi:hypothetical protein